MRIGRHGQHACVRRAPFGSVTPYAKAMKQRTLAREVTISGQALHTGETVTLTLKPAAPGAGYVFRRIDLNGAPEIKPRASLLGIWCVKPQSRKGMRRFILSSMS